MTTESTAQAEQSPNFSHRFNPEDGLAIDAFDNISSQAISTLMLLSGQFEMDNETVINDHDVVNIIYGVINSIKDMGAIYRNDYKHQFNANRVKTGVDCEPKRTIRSRDDLSFTKRDHEGRMLNWFMPDRNGNYHEHYGIGEIWFNEIVDLARHNTQDAYDAMKFAGPELTRYWNNGHSEGFFDRMSRWALAGIISNPDEPIVPFKFCKMGKPPVEGMDNLISRAIGSGTKDGAA
ncbi:hypothetical protein [Methylomonas sp. MK1]|uniref:hypothetical protein n=1 Tax=Methylomonas sp. MK1 TaxID=1131552 RepID=UPI00036E536E|nr:hypothetical protein [Methylomonas sp. MK1]